MAKVYIQENRIEISNFENGSEAGELAKLIAFLDAASIPYTVSASGDMVTIEAE